MYVCIVYTYTRVSRTCMYTIHFYTDIQREQQRERERESERDTYIYIYRERERDSDICIR